jgi:hypothetical protein
VVVPHLNVRGDIGAACVRLRSALRDFDLRKASRPPYSAPEWAEPFLAEGGTKALGAFLEKVHPRRRGKPRGPRAFADLEEVQEKLDVEAQAIRLSRNLVEAISARAPEYGRDFGGYAEEAALLSRLTYCRNDRIKFEAIQGYATFAPVGEVGFLVKRAEERTQDSLNPNVVLCNCMSAIGVMAERFPGATDRRSRKDREALLAALPTLVDVLDREARNNGACRLARDSIAAIVRATGAPEALLAYLHSLKAPGPDSEWMRKLTERFHAETLTWLKETTGQDLGADFARWRAWAEKNRDRLYYDPRRETFRIDAAAARTFRKRLASLR